ncbi:MAG: helix-turn-helix domain-containing protein [bacterium]
METLGERVKRLREAMGLTQRELAKRIGTSSGLISFIERDKNKPSYEVIRRLSEVLGTSTDYLIYGKSSLSRLEDLLEKARLEARVPYFIDTNNGNELKPEQKKLLAENILARLSRLSRVDLKIILGILEQLEKGACK